MSQSHLQGGRVDISLIENLARNSLITLLEKCVGPKLIVWENSLAGPVGLIAQYHQLEAIGVQKMFPLRNTPLPETNVKHVIFITRPKLHSMDLVAYNVHQDSVTASGKHKQYHLFFVPKFSLLCQKRLENQRMLGSLTLIEEFQCELFPFESDLLSLEIPEMFSEYHIQNDPSTLYQIAHSLISLQKIYGQIPRVWGKGQAAKQVWDLVQRLQRESNLHETYKTHRSSTIDQILLIDRSIDLITPLVTQLTYEGLIDEIYGINTATATFPSEKFKSNEERVVDSLREERKKIILNSGDKLFASLRDKHFNAVGPYLSKQAKLISSQMEDRHKKSVQEMKLFVQRLPALMGDKKALAEHTAIAECIKEVTDGCDFLDYLQTGQEFLNGIELDRASAHVEALLAQKAPMVDVLRLICLQCIAASGMKPKLLEYYKREVVQVYGIQALIALTHLEQVGLLRCQSGVRPYLVLRKALHLTMEDTSEVSPTDVSYVHSGYAPLSVRIIEKLMKNEGWKQLQDLLGLLPGPTFEDNPIVFNQRVPPQSTEAPTVVLVLFIGGCTYAEISALRYLSQKDDSNVEFIIATTKLINGKTFLNNIINVDTKETKK